MRWMKARSRCDGTSTWEKEFGKYVYPIELMMFASFLKCKNSIERYCMTLFVIIFVFLQIRSEG